jgi:ADP-ribose diphosphatase
MRDVVVESEGPVYQGFFRVTQATLRVEHAGVLSPPMTRESFDRGNSAAALLYKPASKTVILVRQFRYPAYRARAVSADLSLCLHGDGWPIEIAAGSMEPGDTPEGRMAEEIMEETGYRPLRMRHIHTILPSPGGTSELVFVFFAEIPEDPEEGGGGLLGEGEFIEVLEMPLEHAIRRMHQSEIQAAPAVIALQWAELQLAKGKL